MGTYQGLMTSRGPRACSCLCSCTAAGARGGARDGPGRNRGGEHARRRARHQLGASTPAHRAPGRAAHGSERRRRDQCCCRRGCRRSGRIGPGHRRAGRKPGQLLAGSDRAVRLVPERRAGARTVLGDRPAARGRLSPITKGGPHQRAGHASPRRMCSPPAQRTIHPNRIAHGATSHPSGHRPPPRPCPSRFPPFSRPPPRPFPALHPARSPPSTPPFSSRRQADPAGCACDAQMLELPQNVVETSPAYRVLAQTVENLKRDATEARTAEADYRSQLDVYLAQRHAFVEEMEVRCRTAAAIVKGKGGQLTSRGGARVWHGTEAKRRTRRRAGGGAAPRTERAGSPPVRADACVCFGNDGAAAGRGSPGGLVHPGRCRRAGRTATACGYRTSRSHRASSRRSSSPRRARRCWRMFRCASGPRMELSGRGLVLTAAAPPCGPAFASDRPRRTSSGRS